MFVRSARSTPGVLRIALLGSLATDKPMPKDADVLVTIDAPVEKHGVASHLLGSLVSPVRGEVRHSKDLPPPESADAVRPAVGNSRRHYRGHPWQGALDLPDWLSQRLRGAAYRGRRLRRLI
jgi:hypothetical protein